MSLATTVTTATGVTTFTVIPVVVPVVIAIAIAVVVAGAAPAVAAALHAQPGGVVVKIRGFEVSRRYRQEGGQQQHGRSERAQSHLSKERNSGEDKSTKEERETSRGVERNIAERTRRGSTKASKRESVHSIRTRGVRRRMPERTNCWRLAGKERKIRGQETGDI